MSRCGLQPEARIVRGVSHDHDERASSIAEKVQPSRDELRADPGPLAVGEDGHRRQSHPDDPLSCALDHHRREEDVPHDAGVLGDERQRVGAGLPQSVDEIGFGRLSEGQFVDASDLSAVRGSFRPDGNQMLERSADYNMAAVAWTGGGRSLVIVGEIPCSSFHGGIMCQVMGYEIEVPTGRILCRMTARELKRRYQSEMAWDLTIPDQPWLR